MEPEFLEVEVNGLAGHLCHLHLNRRQRSGRVGAAAEVWNGNGCGMVRWVKDTSNDRLFK